MTLEIALIDVTEGSDVGPHFAAPPVVEHFDDVG